MQTHSTIDYTFLPGLVAGASALFGGASKARQSKIELEAEKERTKQLALAALAEKEEQPSSNTIWWIIGGIGIVGMGVLIFIGTKHMRQRA